MREFLVRHRPAIVAFLGLTLPLFLLYVHGRENRKTTIIEKALTQVTAPVQGAASRLLSGLSDLWNGYIALTDVADENEKLKSQVDKLSEQATRSALLEDENKRLRALLDFKRARRELVTVGAHVIGKNVSPYARVVRISIDLDGRSGIAEGMPVIDEYGLVGRIAAVSGGYAEVLLAVDPRSTVNVKVLGKGVTGTLTGTTSQSNYVSRFTYLHRAEPLAEGDLLVTSGHDKVFPPGLPVGTIRSLDERQRDVEYELQVTPTVNFSDLDLVMVVTAVVDEAAEPPPIETPQGPSAPAPQHGASPTNAPPSGPPTRPQPSHPGGNP